MKHLVIIGKTFPEPQSTAAGTRMLQLMDLFLEQGYQITFLSSASPGEKSFNLSDKGINGDLIQVNDSRFDETIKKLNPNIVLYDRFSTEEQFGWRVSQQFPNALKILDTEDLHFLRTAREKAFKEKKTLENADLLNEVFKREMASILRCDLSLIISTFEMNLLIHHFGISANILHYLPLFGEKKNNAIAFSERKNFISIGNFLHEPNWQTVLQLKKIWKTLKRQIPAAELHIYGAYASEKVYQLHHEKEGFIIKGRAEKVETVFDAAKVLLAPIPFGAGIKGKLLESMQYGLPNVTSSIGAEAMHGQWPWNGFVADQEEDFMEKAVLLYQNENTWKAAQEKGYHLVNSLFKKDLFQADFSQKVEDITHQLTAHRNAHFWGQILQHHTLQSSKYLSKWIEEKNKKKNP